jgi:hypothetical protein
MSTLAETQALLRPYVERHPDLVLIGRAVILRPMRHLLCGYFVDRTSVPHMSRPFWFANIVYRFIPSTGFLWAGDHVPRWSDTRTEDFQHRLFASMDRAFAELRKFNGAVDVFDIELPMNRDLTSHSVVQGLTRVAKGDLEGAEPFLLRELAYQTRDLEDRLAFIAKYRRKDSKPWQRDMWIRDLCTKARANNLVLIDLVAKRDRVGAASLLREWERLYVQAWKAERHWISSPFPFEAGSSRT